MLILRFGVLTGVHSQEGHPVGHLGGSAGAQQQAARVKPNVRLVVNAPTWIMKFEQTDTQKPRFRRSERSVSVPLISRLAANQVRTSSLDYNRKESLRSLCLATK